MTDGRGGGKIRPPCGMHEPLTQRFADWRVLDGWSRSVPQANLSPVGRVLVIDDDPARRQDLAAVLEDAGYRVARTASLSEGLALVSAQTVPVCVLADADGDAAPAVGAPVTLDLLERKHIEAVLAGSTTLDAAARTLGIDSSTLYRKRKAYGL